MMKLQYKFSNSGRDLYPKHVFNKLSYMILLLLDRNAGIEFDNWNPFENEDNATLFSELVAGNDSYLWTLFNNESLRIINSGFIDEFKGLDGLAHLLKIEELSNLPSVTTMAAIRVYIQYYDTNLNKLCLTQPPKQSVTVGDYFEYGP